MLRQPKLVLKVSQVPDWGRRAIRLSLALTFFTTIAIWLWPVPESLRAEWGDEVRQTCNWAGASCAVVAASPLIGKVAQLSYERTLGTLTGGLLGFLVYDYGVLLLPGVASDVLMVASTALVGALSCFLSYKYKLDASMRLFVITFLIVVFGGGTHSALGVALLRTGGIVTGVLLFMGLTVVVLPKSATIEALREMKSGLKLLTELNTLVWTSKQEAEAALKAAAAAARAAELAAATAASLATKSSNLSTAADIAAGGSRSEQGTATSKGVWWSVSTALGALLAPQQKRYQRLPDSDPEAGLRSLSSGGAAAWQHQPLLSADAAAAAHAPSAVNGASSMANSDGRRGSSAGQHPVSHLTQALKAGSRNSQAGQALQQQQQPQQLAGVQVQGMSYEQFMDAYEERCEEVLTKVYQSMFKVKEHVQLADSEVYVYHFCGHYLFVPLFFNRALINWLLPKRWRLPAAALEEVSTSVRVIARLLWTVHLDFSQEGFDEVIQAIPAAAGMGNLLLDLAACTSASLGVLVEAFPNKEAVLVDNLKALEALVNRMLEISGDQHEALIRELAANRTKTARTHRADSAGGVPRSPMHYQHQLQHDSRMNNSPFSGLASADLGSRPAAAALAAVSGDGPAMADAAASAAARLGVELHTPRTAQHIQQQQQGQGPRQEVWFVTFDDDHDDDNMPIVDVNRSMAVEGLGPPIPAVSPELWSPHTPATAASPAPDVCPASAGAGQSGDLMFDMAASPARLAPAAAAAAAGGAKPPAGNAASRGPDAAEGSSTATGAAADGGTQPGLSLARNESHRSSGLLSSSLIRAQFKPMVKAPTLKLNRHLPQHLSAAGPHSSLDMPLGRNEGVLQQAAGSGDPGAGLFSAGDSSGRPPVAVSYLRSTSLPDPAAAEAAVALLQEFKQQELTVPLQPHVQQPQAQQQQAVGGVQPAQLPAGAYDNTGVSASLMLEALNDPETMSFVKLTRWYSFQFLMMELLIELHDLYHHIREVLTTLPHGL